MTGTNISMALLRTMSMKIQTFAKMILKYKSHIRVRKFKVFIMIYYTGQSQINYTQVAFAYELCINRNEANDKYR